MGLLPEAYRQLSMQGKIGFSLFTILDVVVIILMFVSPAISPIDAVSLIFGIVYILQTLAWIILYLVLGRVCNIQMWGLPALASMIFYYFQTNQTTLTEIGVQFIWVRLFFIGMYPADWSVIIPGKFEKRMAEYGDGSNLFADDASLSMSTSPSMARSPLDARRAWSLGDFTSSWTAHDL